MKHFADVTRIIESGIKGDVKKVIDYSLLLAGKLEASGETAKAERIQKILKQHGFSDSTVLAASALKETGASNFGQIPFDQESKLELADIYLPNQLEHKKIILSQENNKQIEEFIRSLERADELATVGLDLSTSMLLYGPPGCGKTETAFSVGKRLNLPVVVARLDTLISSYLGSTSKNIRLLFEFARKTPCVLFLDEFDAVAKLRDDQHEMGELKRVVNSLLQNIDSLNENSILIAATNHEKLLDDAIWRRFDTRIHIGLPNEEMIRSFLNHLFVGKNLITEEKRQSDFLSRLLVGQSFSDIEQIVKKSLRKSVLDQRPVEIADVVDSFFEYKQFILSPSEDMDTIRRRKIRYLLELNMHLSNRFLGEVMKCHHNTIKTDLEKIEEKLEV